MIIKGKQPIAGWGMNQILTSNAYRFEIQGQEGFTLIPEGNEKLRMDNCRIKTSYYIRGRRCEDVLSSLLNPVFTSRHETGRVGPLSMLVLDGKSRKEEIFYRVYFALADESPLFLWKVELDNHSDQVVEMERFDMLRIGINNAGGKINIPAEQRTNLAFFSNGWQSWSHTGVYGANEKQKPTRLGPFSEPMNCNRGTPKPRQAGFFSSDFYGVVGDRLQKWGLLLGFLSQKEQFGTVEARIKNNFKLGLWANGDRAQIRPGRSMQTDWAVISHLDLSVADPLAPYLDGVARENEARVPKHIHTGWCSWYEYYTHITPGIITQNLELIAQNRETLPVEVVQIDDGFEAQVGDWLAFRKEFPEGVAGLANKIKEKGLLPGLWLAPFILHPGAKICKQHADWVLKNRWGRAVNAGFVWNSFTTALDITRPEVMEYIKGVIKTAVSEWGFPYLKLDFLYAAALPGNHADATLTRAQIMRKSMEMIREAMGGDSFLLGCGAPLGSMLGVVDAMRISCDVAGEWEPQFNGISFFFKDEPFMPSARNAIQNIISRVPLHQRWWTNDPDCLLVRPNTKLTLDEVKTLATAIGMSGGMMLLSDNMASLDADRLRMAQVLLPLIGSRPQVVDWFESARPQKLRQDFTAPCGEWQVVAWFNWDDSPVEIRLAPSDFNLEDGEYMVRNFWSGRQCYSSSGSPLWQESVAPHGVLLLVVRKFESSRPGYLGSDLHISQGLEVSAWEPAAETLRFTLNTRIDGWADLYLPGAVKTVEIDGLGAIDWEKNEVGGLRLQIKVLYSGKSILVTFA